MKHQSMKSLLGRSVLAAAMLALVAGSASAATYNLRAGATTVDYGNGPVTAWGYALVSSDIGAGLVNGPDTVTVPGPTIYVPAGQGLTINLENNLGEATSIVVHGQKLTGAPTRNLDNRVTAFTSEAGHTNGTVTYSWLLAELKAGTFLYNSGSHPSKQAHMGLYGAVVVDADSDGDPLTLEAYPGVFYDRDIVVIYSEVDPVLRTATGPAQALNFHPKYFLVNGDPTGSTVLTDDGGIANPAELHSRVLLRFVNAGLKGYVPTLLGEDLDWVAEYGNPYPHVRKSYSAYLSAGKTMDAIWIPETFDRHALFDRRLHMSENGEAGGGLKAFLDSADTLQPTAFAGPDQHQVAMFNGVGDQTVVQLSGSSFPASDFGYEWALVGFPEGSAATLSDPNITNPTFTIDVPGTYTAELVVRYFQFTSRPDTVNIFTNRRPVSNPGPDQAIETLTSFTLDGTASYDPDGDAITYEWKITHPIWGVLPPYVGPTHSFVANVEGLYEMELTVSDGELTDSKTMYVTASTHVNQPPNALDDFYEVLQYKRNQTYEPNTLFVLANDDDADGSIVDASMTIVTEPAAGGSAFAELDTTSGRWVITYTPKIGYKGTEFFTYSICDDEGACSEAQVLVNVIKARRNTNN